MNCANSISKIEPYNDLYFKNCIYNSLFSVINYYNKSIMPFLINSIPIYYYNCDEEKHFSIKYIDTYSTEELLEEMMIVVNSKQNNTSIVEDIITSIDKNEPVIVFINCFYMPVRTENYLKTHLEHPIIIYGYDNIRKVFNIIEQKHNDSLSYYKTELQYNDLINSYNGYINLTTKNRKINSYKEYRLKQNHNLLNNDSSEYIKIFKRNTYINYENINNGLQSLEKFILDFEDIFIDEIVLEKNVNSLVLGLNEIINSKKVEKYKIEKLFGKDHTLYILILKIEDNWSSIRYTLAKYMFSSLYNQQRFEKLKSIFIDIQDIEDTYYNLICKL